MNAYKSWKIVFQGETLPGLNKESVQKDCIQLLGLSPEKVERMFSGRKITLRKNLNQERLEKYATFFQRCGMRVYIVEEKESLSLIDESQEAQNPDNPTMKSTPRPMPLGGGRRPPEQDNNDEVFAQQTILSPLLGQNNFYDALIRQGSASTTEDAQFSSTPKNKNTFKKNGAPTPPKAQLQNKTQAPTFKKNNTTTALILVSFLALFGLISFLYLFLFD